jgi:glucosamine-6-phosphate deaminase
MTHDSVLVPERRVDHLVVRCFEDTAAMARTAAEQTADVVRAAVAAQGHARVAMATGNSQIEMVTALGDIVDVPWDRVTVFHLDEYIDIDDDHPASFRRWIRERIELPLGPERMHYIQGDASDIEAECRRYEALLREAPLDLICLGIGENGHIAFNDPGADLEDTVWARAIELDDRSRQQQVNEGHFPSVAETAPRAITLTVPALLAAKRLHVVVPERRKAEAVRSALTQPVSSDCPATALRTHGDAVLFLDPEAAALIDV